MRRPRVPRNKLSAKTGGLSTTYRSRYLNQAIASGASSQGFGIIPIQPSMTVGRGSDPGIDIAGSHQEFLVHQSTFVYTPSVGTTTPGTLFVAWVDNPEIIGRFYGADSTTPYTATQYLQIAQTMSKGWSTPVWQALTCSNAGIPPRRKMFATDSTTPTSMATVDRCIQGAWVFATVGLPASTTAGYAVEEYSASLKGPQQVGITLI